MPSKERDAPRQVRKKSQKRPGVFSSVYFAEPDDHEAVTLAAAAEGVSVNEFLVRLAVRRARLAMRRTRRGKKAA